jgi:cytochrome b
MNRLLVWDIPTRLFHWLLVAGCGAAFVLALAAPEHSLAFDSHMLLGLALLPLLLFRVIWGFFGTRYARFRTFLFSPTEMLAYLTGMMTRSAQRHVGHNPAASYAIFAMLALLAGIGVTGLLIPGGGERYEDLHEVMSYALLVLIGGHLLGVLFHTMAHKENIVLSMLTGRKAVTAEEGIPSSRPVVAVIALVLLGAWSAALVTTYDTAARRLDIPFVGKSFQLGKSEMPHGTQHEDDD